MNDPPDQPAPPSEDLVSRLSRLRPVEHGDENSHPHSGDSDSGHTIYPGPPVPLPRWLWGGKKKRSREN
jgi:hypothetical protein